jgi:transcriptional regulator with XRE-family HTH domain
MSKNSDFAVRLRAAREARGLSKSELARRVGVTPAAVGNWEAGYTRPRSETYTTLSALLNFEQEPADNHLLSSTGAVKSNSSLIEEFRNKLAAHIGHPAERINVQVTLT